MDPTAGKMQAGPAGLWQALCVEKEYKAHLPKRTNTVSCAISSGLLKRRKGRHTNHP